LVAGGERIGDPGGHQGRGDGCEGPVLARVAVQVGARGVAASGDT
jgi:hypothetical protein